MKITGMMVCVAALLVVGCASGPPDRGADYWAKFLDDERPTTDPEERFVGEGERDFGVAPAIDEGFAFRVADDFNNVASWIIELRPDHSGYFVFREQWIDGAILRQRHRIVRFKLTKKEQQAVRDVIADSGYLALRPEYQGSGNVDWMFQLRDRYGDAHDVTMQGAFPDEAEALLKGLIDTIMKPRTDKMASAEEIDPMDEDNAAIFSPLK